MSQDDMKRFVESVRNHGTTLLSTEPPPPYSGRRLTSSAHAARGSANRRNEAIRQRKLELQQELIQANANATPRDTSGLFKKAAQTDLLFLIDGTNSMSSYISSAKDQVKRIIEELKETFLNECDVRIAVVVYRDHRSQKNIESIGFTSSVDDVHRFLDRLETFWGHDFPEDVLGGINAALKLAWKHPSRCLIHIADAPPHGKELHDLGPGDDYYHSGTEPHGLTYKPLLEKMIKLDINYTLLRIHSATDRMALVFAKVYGPRRARLHRRNTLHGLLGLSSYYDCGPESSPRFEEMLLGVSYQDIQRHVVNTVTSTFSRTAGRLTMSAKHRRNNPNPSNHLDSIREADDAPLGGATKPHPIRPSIPLDPSPPRWHDPLWLTQTLHVQAFCPISDLYHSTTLNDFLASDDHIKLGHADFTLHSRPNPFAHGALRSARYARTAASTQRFVLKSPLAPGRRNRPQATEEMLVQVLCKAFALEFNGLLALEPPLDFLTSICVETSGEGGECLSLEPFVEGTYVKYNSNSGYVSEMGGEENALAQAFSHFTFERSWGHFLVDDLQGVGRLLTDPAVQTRDERRFGLSGTNLGEEGFKFFFATHRCNGYCERLGLVSDRKMFTEAGGESWRFRETWPVMEPTVCCASKLCRRIVRRETARGGDGDEVERHLAFLPRRARGYLWCDSCWEQLWADRDVTGGVLCEGPGPAHRFEVSRFFHESQGEIVPKCCIRHRASDPSASGAAAVGGDLFSRLVRSKPSASGSFSGKAW